MPRVIFKKLIFMFLLALLMSFTTQAQDTNVVSFSVNGPVDSGLDGIQTPPPALWLPFIRFNPAPQAVGIDSVIRPGDVWDYLNLTPLVPSEAEIFQSEPDHGPAGPPAGTNNQILQAIAIGLQQSHSVDNVNAYTFGEDFFNGDEDPQGHLLIPEAWGWEDRFDDTMYHIEPVVAGGGLPITFYFSVDPWAIGLGGTSVQTEATTGAGGVLLTLPVGPGGAADVDTGGVGLGPWESDGEASGDVYTADPITAAGTNVQIYDEVILGLLATRRVALEDMEDDLDALECIGDNTIDDGISAEAGNTHDRVMATLGMNGGYHTAVDDLGDPFNPNHDPSNLNPIIFSVDRNSMGTPGSAVEAQVLSAVEGASGDLFIAVTIQPGGTFVTTNMLLIDEGQLGLMPDDDLDAVIVKLLITPSELAAQIDIASSNFSPGGGSQGYGFTKPLLSPLTFPDMPLAAVGFSVDTASIGLLRTAVDFECRVDGFGIPGPVPGSGVMEQAGDIFFADCQLIPGAMQDPGTLIPYSQNYLWFEEVAIGLDPGTWTFMGGGSLGDLGDLPDELNALDSDGSESEEILKFQQLPLNGPIYFGHDELSTAYAVGDLPNGDPVGESSTLYGYDGCYMADDFADLVHSDVIHVRWWGSLIENMEWQSITKFLIAFEADVPAGYDLEYSHPGEVLSVEIVTLAINPPTVTPGEYIKNFYSYGGPPCNEKLWQYDAVLNNPFPEYSNTVYWLKIVALVDDVDSMLFDELRIYLEMAGLTLCEYLKMPAADQLIWRMTNCPPELWEFELTRWGWHNRDYTINDPYASTSPAVNPGEWLEGGVYDPISDTYLDVWHFQDDCVSGPIYVYADDPYYPWIEQYEYWPEYYVWWLPYCDDSTGGGVDGPDGIEYFSKDLAFELYAGEVEEEELDFGDAPDPYPVALAYPTLLINNGARHMIVPNVYLGASVDGEPDGQPNGTATGDDLDILYPPVNDDEDGVLFANGGVLKIGVAEPITVTANVAGYLNVWVDFNANFSWGDAGEWVFMDQPLAAGINNLTITVPTGSTFGPTYARFRFTQYYPAGTLWYDGPANDGEVEDYEVTIDADLDFGDAWDDWLFPRYPTLLSNNGARHVIVPNVYLGASVDAEPDGQPDLLALGDDNDGNDDEDGVVFVNGTLTAGQPEPITVTANVAGYLNAWVDFNANSSWGDAGEWVFINQPLAAGVNNLTINVPAGANLGFTYARFRFTSQPNFLSYDDLADDGEVEDYEVVIEAQAKVTVPKFIQLPLDGLTYEDGTYWGHDELSTAYSDDYDLDGDIDDYIGCFMADDFADLADTEVIRVKWWGSLIENLKFQQITKFLIAFESDVPEGGGEPFSHPGTPISWEIVILNTVGDPTALNPGEYSVNLESNGGPPCNEKLYRYEALLANPFPEEPDTVYWLKIVALVDVDPMLFEQLQNCLNSNNMTLCEYLKMPADSRRLWRELHCLPELLDFELTTWGWHNRDYSVPDVYASVPPAVSPGEFRLPTPFHVKICHFQDDCVSGDMQAGVVPGLNEIEWIEQINYNPERYAHYLPHCPGPGVDGPPGIEEYSKDLAFILYTEKLACFPSGTAYSTQWNWWVQFDAPLCWCNYAATPSGTGDYQCDGDTHLGIDTLKKFRVSGVDLAIVVANWQKRASDFNPAYPMGDPPPGVVIPPARNRYLNPCADVSHNLATLKKFQVSGIDLEILVDNWQAKNSDLPGNCPVDDATQFAKP